LGHDDNGDRYENNAGGDGRWSLHFMLRAPLSLLAAA
jgi:hypothetical protein